MYYIVLSMILFSKEEWIWCFSFKNWHACGYLVLLPSVEKQSACHILLKCRIENVGYKHISLFRYSYWENYFIFWFDSNPSKPYQFGTYFIWVSSIINSATFVFLQNNLLGLYFWIPSLIAEWLLLWTNLCNAFAVFLKERPLKYRVMHMLYPKVLFYSLSDIS